MKRTLSITLAVALVFAVSLAFAGPVFQPTDGDSYDFGTVSQGESVEHAFAFKNAGDDTLRILNVKAS